MTRPCTVGLSWRAWLVAVIVMMALPLLSQAQSDEARLIAIAKAAIVAEVNGQSQPSVQGRQSPQPVFVTIEVGNKVIGCRGGLTARSSSLEEEIRLAARSAAAHDPRYRPLTKKDIVSFQVTITLVQSLQPISNVNGLVPDDGLVLTAGGKAGIVLPWEGKDPKTRLDWAYRKAGVQVGTPVKLQRLKAIRFKG